MPPLQIYCRYRSTPLDLIAYSMIHLSQQFNIRLILRTSLKITGLWLLVFFSLFSNLMAQGIGKNQSIGKVVAKKPTVSVLRNGKSLPVSGFGRHLQIGDTILTQVGGKAHIILKNGNQLFLAPDARLVISEKLIGKSKSGIKHFILSIYGKIRLQIKKTKTRQVQVRTKTAVIGVKGTDFIVSYENNITTVATLDGLVNMASIINQEHIDIPPGKMSSVSPTGKVLSLSDIANEILQGLEFAGERVKESEISGKRIKN